MKKRKIVEKPRDMSEKLSASRSAAGHSSSSSQTSQAARLTISPPPPPPPSPPPPSLSNSASGEQVKVCRGYSKGVPTWNTGVQMSVCFDNTFQPIGEGSAPLKAQLGILCRDGHRLPLIYLDWTAIDETIKEGIWIEVKTNVKDVPIGYRDVCLKTCNNLWKDHKAKIKKKYFVKHKNDPNLHLMVPPGVVPEQWPILVDYWRNQEAEVISKRNSINRETRGPPHITGRKSHAQIRYDMQQKGEPTDKMTVWLRTRNQNDHDVIQARTDYQEALDKEPEDQRQLTSVKDRIFHELIGQDGHGHCRTYGSSVPRSVVYSHAPTSAHVSTSDLVENITKEVTKRLTEQFSL